MNEPEKEISTQKTLTMWRWPVTPAEIPPAPDVVRRIERHLLVTSAIALVVAVLASAAYAVGYASGHTHAIAGASATVTAASSSWRVVWEHKGHGRQELTPPAIDQHTPARILLVWSCEGTATAPAGATTLLVSIGHGLGQAAHPLAYTSCPGFGDTVVTVGPDVIADTLQYGAYQVVMDAPDDTAWRLAVEWPAVKAGQ